MAKGDVRQVQGGSSGGYGGGGSYYYNDEGRGDSKLAWERFQEGFIASEYNVDWLFGLPDEECYLFIHDSRLRYGIEDIAVYRNFDVDSRARRFVEQKLADKHEGIWKRFHSYLVQGYDRQEELLERQEAERNKKWNEKWEIEQAERKAEVARIAREDAEKISKEVDLTAGSLRSEFLTALDIKEVHGRDEGDWLEDPVEAIRTGYGFGTEEKEAGGIKLQITLSIDLSNSMYYNGIHIAAASAFRELGMSLRQIQSEHPNDIYLGFFTFSLDDYDKPGKRARRLTVNEKGEDEYCFFEFETFRPSKVAKWEEDMKNSWGGWGKGVFTGEDTWMHPLFAEIEKWENESSDPNTARIDIVLTDAVLEHPTDIRQCDVIQERRDGNLQTVFLNFMPKEEWSDGTMPLRCVQYQIGGEVSNMVRLILQNFLALYV